MLFWFARIRATFWLFGAYARALLHYRNNLWKNIDLPGNNTLDARERKRLKHYFYGVTFLAALMGNFRGHIRNKQERFLFDQLAALAFFFDDLSESFEAAGMDPAIWDNDPETYGALADQRGLALHLLGRVYRHLPPERHPDFRRYLFRVFNLEIQGRQQKTSIAAQNLSLESLLEITAEKGGASVLLFRSVLDEPLSGEEAEAFYQFGALIQLCDDIFDLWHDRRDGIETPATFLASSDDVVRLRNVFEQQRQRCHAAFLNTGRGKMQVDSSLHILHYLVSITRVCLNHYERLIKVAGRLPLENRTEIVVDMEKWSNIFSSVRELLRRVR